ncbi:MAG: hypothetical protein HKN23_03195 [Verrucomicrobiales bacterium]|nr:hypothetical protein [Verrucomicrobiales bacterium]
MRRFGKENRGADFYRQALCCAQSLWLQGVPAQALLQLNRAFGSDLPAGEPVLQSHPLPYAAMAWIMQNREEDRFIGNPRRHFQHYATRMNEPRKELRTWRAWGCWAFACRIFPDFPADEKQIAGEGIVEPSADEIFRNLSQLGLPGEAALWGSIYEQTGSVR